MSSRAPHDDSKKTTTESGEGADGVSRRKFLSKAAVAGAATYMVAQGAERADAQSMRERRSTTKIGPINMEERPPVSPTLKLSDKALRVPFKQELEWLPEVRDFLTRNGGWIDHGIDLGELYIRQPAIGVVGMDGGMNWESSLGFGDLAMGNSFSCTDNNCESQMIAGTCQGEDKCNNQWCGKQDCTLDSCNPNSCSNQECDGLQCGNNTSGFRSFVNEIESHWRHPFVHELALYFEVDNFEALAMEVQHYIGRNMYDASAIR